MDLRPCQGMCSQIVGNTHRSEPQHKSPQEVVDVPTVLLRTRHQCDIVIAYLLECEEYAKSKGFAIINTVTASVNFCLCYGMPKRTVSSFVTKSIILLQRHPKYHSYINIKSIGRFCDKIAS